MSNDGSRRIQTRNNDDSNSERRRQRIQRLSNQIERLATQLNELIIADQQAINQARNERAAAPRRVAPAIPPHFEPVAEPQAYQEVAAPVTPSAIDPRIQLRELVIGDRIEILNNYQGLRGSRGVVAYTTAHQVTVRLDGERRVRNKSRLSVRKVTD